jgi:CheY-like chemotaxis protein
LNLILNARDALEYVEQDPHISIILRIAKTRQKSGENARRAHIIVEDNGSGIPAHLLKRIFEPYFTTKEAGQGTGLGLSIVKSLVEMNNAQIAVRSFEGRGTKFIVSFSNPKFDGGAEIKNAIAKPTLSNLEPFIHESLRGKSILIVEDDTAILEACSKVFERLGVTVTACVNAGEAILYAERTVFDLLLSDIVLPGVSGVELWERLQKDQLARACVFMTGYESNLSIAKWPEIDVLRKPFSPIALLQACTAALRHRD